MIPDRVKIFYFSPKRSHADCEIHPVSYKMRTEVAPLILGASGLKTKLTTYLHLDPRSRVSGAIHPIP